MYFCQDEYTRTFYPYLAVAHLCEFEYQQFISILIEMDACLEVWKLADNFKDLTLSKTVVLYAVPRLEGSAFRLSENVGMDKGRFPFPF